MQLHMGSKGTHDHHNPPYVTWSVTVKKQVHEIWAIKSLPIGALSPRPGHMGRKSLHIYVHYSAHYGRWTLYKYVRYPWNHCTWTVKVYTHAHYFPHHHTGAVQDLRFRPCHEIWGIKSLPIGALSPRPGHMGRKSLHICILFHTLRQLNKNGIRTCALSLKPWPMSSKAIQIRALSQ